MASLGHKELTCCLLLMAEGLLTHWGQVTHICVSKLTIISSDNGLSPDRRQAIIWTNAGILSIGPLGTNFSEILFENQTISLKKMHLKMSSAKSWPFCLGLNVLMACCLRVIKSFANCQMIIHWLPKCKEWNHWNFDQQQQLFFINSSKYLSLSFHHHRHHHHFR